MAVEVAGKKNYRVWSFLAFDWVSNSQPAYVCRLAPVCLHTICKIRWNETE